MIGKDQTLQILQNALNYSWADQIEARLYVHDTYVTRFANSYIHQNVAERNNSLSIRAIIGKKIGSASSNSIEEDSLRETVNKAIEMAKHQHPNIDFKSLPTKKPIKYINTFIEATKDYTPEQRAEGILKVITLAKKQNLVASGAFTTGVVELGIANSLGIEVYHQFTEADFNTIISSQTSSGYGNIITKDVNEIDFLKIATEAIEKCLLSKDPISIEPGEYEVVLEEYAVSDLMNFLGYLGFGALSVQEGRSFMGNNFGKKIMGSNITIWDDGLDERGLPLPFDFEGVPKQKVILIENGIAKNVVYDSYTAGKENKESTGHALPEPNTFGPIPMNLFMASGNSSKEEMIASIKKGIYVTRFHYTNVVEPMKVIITGMTRDGTFLIENGKIKSGIKNLRFTESILKILSEVAMISKETKLVGNTVIPAIKVDRLNFTGATEF